ncbi:MAG: glycoside hydrolase family 3 C-terminal domain-containing protein [Clostridia bacterium]|nr:glycoside hydrolase family 3 C-terminal domain-containing protein [Clostridia bacterium]
MIYFIFLILYAIVKQNNERGVLVNKENRMEFDRQARELVSRLTLEEKIALMGGNTPIPKILIDFMVGHGYNYIPWTAGGNKKEGIPPMAFCDGPRGVVPGTNTCFPCSMARGASFDTDLETRVGEAIGKEVRAVGGNLYAGVCINLPYNAGWGRSQETYGEESYHLGEMGSALVKGVQKHNVIACIKHFAFNSMENSRFKVSVTADKRTEREVFFPHFKKCIDAGAGSVMSAYNKYEGVHCGHSDYLLNRVLKNEWGFDGFVMSDFFFGLKSTKGGLNGGLDIEMPLTMRYNKFLVKHAIKSGKVDESIIDESAVRIVRTLLAYSLAEDPQTYPDSLCACDEHLALSKEVADKSLTLLKNSGVLPFSRNCSKIAVIGDLAKLGNTGDHGSSYIKRGKEDNIFDALTEKFGDRVFFVPTKNVGDNISEIADADAVVTVVGYTYKDEGEYVTTGARYGGDRKDGLGLHAEDIRMIKDINIINKNNCVVVIAGNAVTMEEWYKKTPAILFAYYAGAFAGHSIADTLFGENTPSGKLPFAIPQNEGDLAAVDWKAKEQHYDYYCGYMKLEKENLPVRFPYGFGLSYTEFKVDNIYLKYLSSETAVFSVDVENSGTLYGGEVIQCYVGFKNSAVDRPVKVLRAFNKVYLIPGEKKSVELRIKKSDLAYYDREKADYVKEDITYIAYIGTSSRPEDLTAGEFEFRKAEL